MAEVSWSENALNNLNDIGEYISVDIVKYAQITVEELFTCVDILSNFPESGRIVPEFNNPKIREIIKGNYRLVYKIISKNKIVVLTVHHSKRLLIKSTK
jgi:addiction module RelE/StbE family toxin